MIYQQIERGRNRHSFKGFGILLLVFAWVSFVAAAQDMPKTPGETLSGQHLVLADAVQGHPAVIIAGFSHEGGTGASAWAKALHGDAVLKDVPVYTMAMLEGAPGFVRGMIKSAMKKGVPPADQAHFVVLTNDAQAWRSYFGVTDEKVPYVVLLDAAGKVLWHGHGPAAESEPQLRSALP